MDETIKKMRHTPININTGILLSQRKEENQPFVI